MDSEGQAWGHPIFIPSGTFYLADDLHIFKSLELFGTGSQGESILMFPKGKSVIIDPSTNEELERTGAECVIRDLQIKSEEEWTATIDGAFAPQDFEPAIFEGKSKGTPGISMHAASTIQRVSVSGFTGTGIHISGGDIIVNAWRLHDVYVNKCGGHGIHVDGGNTQSSLCTGAKVIAVGGNGIYESSSGGNTYIGCDVEEIKARGYVSDSGGQATFVGCFAEAVERTHLSGVSGGTSVWVGGSSAAGFTDDTSAFVVEGYANVHPFEVPNLKDRKIRLLIGYPNHATDPTTICAWANNNGDDFGPEVYVMRWDMDNKIWAVENGGMLPDDDGKLFSLRDRDIAYYLTGKGHPRGPWLQGFVEMLLGSADGPIKLSRGDRPDDGAGEQGDIVYNTQPKVDEHIGWVCIGAAREWKPFGKIEA